jgi:hypothetical protein
MSAESDKLLEEARKDYKSRNKQLAKLRLEMVKILKNAIPFPQK